MKVLVTGGTGFLGKATSLKLIELGHTVSIVGRNAKTGSELEKKGIRFFKTDLSDNEGINKACHGQEVVIHSAALASPFGKYEKFYEANVIGTQNVLDSCYKHGVRRFVNLSTPSLYFDYTSRLNIKESDPLPKKQVTAYGATKLLADQEVEAAAKKGLETISLRPRAIFGPEDQTVLGRLIKAAEKGTAPLINGGKSYVDLTYIDNVVDAVLLAMQAGPEALGKVFNITNGEPLTSKEMMERVFSRLKLQVKYKKFPFWTAYAAAAALDNYYVLFKEGQEPPMTRYTVGLLSKSQTLDITQARTVLKYTPKISLNDGFDRYAKWWLTDLPK
jgi:nucleoside-diphosphate-sugar epimerase